jgi:hypothetical protein
MIFIKVFRFENVSMFMINENDFIYQDSESIYDKSLFFNGLFIFGPGVASINLTENLIYFTDWNSNYYISNFKGNYELYNTYLFEKSKNYSLEYSIDKKIIYKNLSLGKTKLFDKKTSVFHRLIFMDVFFESDNFIISAFDLFSDLWSLEISKLGYFDHPHEVLQNSVEVQQFIGVYEGVLWVFLRNQVMLGINTSNGELLHKILGMEPSSHQNADYDVAWSTDTLALLPNTTWHLAESAGIIKGLAHQSYIEIDIKHKPTVAEKPKGMFAGFFASKKVTEVYPTIKRYHFYTQMQSLGLRNIAARHTIIDDEAKNIYFFDETESRWGIYNTNGLRFEYISDQIPVKSQKKETYTRIKEIKQGGSKVYVLDMQQTLHIFEKEKS